MGEPAAASPVTPIAPGATIGILGGGQLGRMLAVAAAQLGYHCHVYAPEAEGPASEVARDTTRAEYDDLEALATFAGTCDVLTYEFENVPAAPLRAIADLAALRPGPLALDTAQSRIDEKRFVKGLGGAVAAFAFAETADDLDAALAESGRPAIIKSNRFGYDGKGQARVYPGDDAVKRWQEAGAQPSIVEGLVDFEGEFSVIMVRAIDGEVRFWDSPHNVHEHGILASSTVPAGKAIAKQVEPARNLARRIAERLDYVGVLTLEFFATAKGPVFNEMAPRVHNSGHWTIEGALTSQFENHIRAICGLPLGDTQMACKGVRMRNLIGQEAGQWRTLLADPANHLHLYGKAEARKGRKMGHVTRLTI